MGGDNVMFQSVEEIIERLSRERGQVVAMAYNPERKLWMCMMPKGGKWMLAAGTEDKTMFGSAFRAWQIWMNRTRAN